MSLKSNLKLKTHTQRSQDSNSPKNKGGMSVLDFIMLGFGSMVGVGWAVSTNQWLRMAGGPLPAFIGFVIGTILLLPIGLSHAELMSALPVSGGVMAYGLRAFGSFASFIGAWFVALAYITILPWEALYINQILTNLIPILGKGPVLYRILDSEITLISIVLSVCFALGLYWINFKGSKLAATLQNFLANLIIVAGVVVVIASLWQGKLSNLLPWHQAYEDKQTMFSGIVRMVVIVPFFMAGFDTITQSVEERHAKLHHRDVAKSLLQAILLAGSFYAIVTLSTSAVLDWRVYADLPSPAMAYVLREAWGAGIGKALYIVIMVGSLAGLFSTWNGMFMAAARLLETMGKAGLIPRIFAKTHSKYQTPITASILCTIAAAIGPFVGFQLIDPLTNLGSFAFIVGWFITCLASLYLRFAEPKLKRSFVAPMGRWFLWLAVIFSGILLCLSFIPGQGTFMGYTALSIFFVWLILGLIFYLVTNGGQRGMHELEQRELLFGPKLMRKDRRIMLRSLRAKWEIEEIRERDIQAKQDLAEKMRDD